MTQSPGNPQPPDPGKRPPPTLGYRAPRDEPPRNSPKQFFLRALAGAGIGIASLVAGGALAAATQSILLFFLPVAMALAATLAYSLRRQKFGYSTGILVAPILLVAGIMVLLVIICGIGAALRF